VHDNTTTSTRGITFWLLAGCAGLLLIATLALLPPEKTLGPVIKVIFLHGALVRIGLLTFLAAGLLGLSTLFTRSEALLRWCLATQKTAVLIWIVYALSSMISTRLSWGEWIAWEEPRVRASVYVLGFGIAALLIVLWVNSRIFTGLTNVLVAIVSWLLVRGASILRHPFDPIGASGSSTYAVLYWLMVAALLVLAGLLIWGLEHRSSSIEPSAIEN
jgi:hypothetical protein